MLSEREVSAAVGSTAYGTDGGKLGTVEAFFVDDRTGAPSWVAVSTGLFGTRHSIVPAVDATFADGTLRVPVTAEAVKSAPAMAGEHLAPADEEALRQHYGLTGGGVGAASRPATGPTARTRSGRRTTDRPDARRGAADRLRRVDDAHRGAAAGRHRAGGHHPGAAGQVRGDRGRADHRADPARGDPGRGGAPRRAHGRRPPAEEGLVPASGTPSDGLPDEIILHTERPVVTVEVVPVERVRLRTEVVQGQETVTEQVQREQIVVDEQRAPGRHSAPGALSPPSAPVGEEAEAVAGRRPPRRRRRRRAGSSRRRPPSPAARPSG